MASEPKKSEVISPSNLLHLSSGLRRPESPENKLNQPPTIVVSPENKQSSGMNFPNSRVEEDPGYITAQSKIQSDSVFYSAKEGGESMMNQSNSRFTPKNILKGVEISAIGKDESMTMKSALEIPDDFKDRSRNVSNMQKVLEDDFKDAKTYNSDFLSKLDDEGITPIAHIHPTPQQQNQQQQQQSIIQDKDLYTPTSIADSDLPTTEKILPESLKTDTLELLKKADEEDKDPEDNASPK